MFCRIFRKMRVKLRRIIKAIFVLTLVLLVWSSLRGFYRSIFKNGTTETGGNQDLIDYISQNLDIRYEFGPGGYRRVTFTNSGSRPIPAGDWSVFFNDVNGIVGVTRTGKLIFEREGLLARHHNGWLFSLTPVLPHTHTNISFLTLPPHGGFINFTLHGLIRSSRFYVFPNWYLTGSTPGLTPRIIRCTASEDLNFVLRDKGKGLQRNPKDRFYDNIIEVEGSGQSSEAEDLERARNKVIPTPLHAELSTNKRISLTESWLILHEPSLSQEAQHLTEVLSIVAKELKSEQKIKLGSSTVFKKFKKTILLLTSDLSSESLEGSDRKLMSELNKSGAYVLDVLIDDVIIVCGQDSSGVFYGIQTLLSLMEGSADLKSVPIGRILDAPRLEYRGLLLDTARNFIEIDTLMEVVSSMSTYKMNKLHLHLTDDQGWRIEIPGLEELTEIGGRRGHDVNETSMLLSYHGSAPHGHSQYYTVIQYRNLLKHARKHHVTVIPEIDMPGHAHAAIQSMRVRHDRQVKAGLKERGEEYLLSEYNDKSVYYGVGDVKDSVINPCINSTRKFVEKIVKEMINLHKGVQDLTTFHLGGDEVPGGALAQSPSCQRLLKEHPELADLILPPQLSFHQTSVNQTLDETDQKKRRRRADRMHVLKRYFTRDVVDLLTGLGLNVQAWEEGFGGDGSSPPPHLSSDWNNKGKDLIINAWNSGKNISFPFANAGYKVILSYAHMLYLDHPPEPDFDERGLAWATSFTSTSRTFSFILPSDKDDKESFSHQIMCQTYDMNSCHQLDHPENIIGVEASLWGEMIRTKQQVHEMLFPRLLAVAERSWHRASWERAHNESDFRSGMKSDLYEFMNTVGHKELTRLERHGIQYRIPLPGASVVRDLVAVNTEFPGVRVEYAILEEGEEVKGGGDNLKWIKYTKDTKLQHKSDLSQIILRSTSYDKKRHSRIVYIRSPAFNKKKKT